MIVTNPENEIFYPNLQKGCKLGEEEMDQAVAIWQQQQDQEKGSRARSFFEGIRDYVNEKQFTIQTPRSTVIWDQGSLKIIQPEKQIAVTSDVPMSQLPSFNIPDFLKTEQNKNMIPLAIGALVLVLLIRK